MNNKRLAAFFTLFLFLFQITLPPFANTLTIGEERELGEKLLYSVRKSFPVIDDPDLTQYINILAKDVLTVAGTQYFDYKFFIVNNQEFNAFAAPSGLIFFFTGLIEKMKTENELVSVMAHEIGHVKSRHIAERLEKNQKIGAVTMGLALASLALGVPALSQGLMTGSLAAGQAISLKYSRQHEEQADRLAFDWLNSLHRDPGSMIGMLRVMHRINRYRMGQVPSYLLTHPNPEMRLGYVESLLEIEKNKTLKKSYPKGDDFNFLRFKFRLMTSTGEGYRVRDYFLNQLSKLGDGLEKTMVGYGLALLESSELNHDKALALMLDVRKQYPGKNILKVDEGIIHLEAGLYDRALELIEQAVSSDPENMYGAFHLARVLMKKGDIDRARSLYNLVMQKIPEYSSLYFELGKLESLDEQSELSSFYLGKYYLFEGRFKLARQKFKLALASKDLNRTKQREAKEFLELLKKMDTIL